MRRYLALAALLVVISIGGLVSPALAQSTGGSFGGGHFGGGGSYSGRSHGGGSVYRGGSSSSSGSSLAGRGGPVGAYILFGLLFGTLGLGFVWAHDKIRGTPSTCGWGQVDLCTIQVALDWRARPEQQARMLALERSSRSSRSGMSGLLRGALTALKESEASWRFVHVQNARPMSAAAARGEFEVRKRQARSIAPRAVGSAIPDPRDALCVLTVVVAAREALRDVTAAADASEMHLFLDHVARVASPRDLVALDITWSPMDPDDRWSPGELSVYRPEFARIDESTLSRVFCDACGAPFSVEQLACPRCAAPR